MRMSGAVALLVLAMSPTLRAQAAAEGLRAGAWAAEMSFDASSPGFDAAILRFRNDRSAWLLGLRVNVEYRDPPAEPRTASTVGLRVGVRSFKSPESAVRPTLGAGLSGTLIHASSGSRAGEAGAYGELGLSRFFGESFAVGMSSDVFLRYAKPSNQGPSVVRFGLDAVRLVAMIVF